MPTTANYGLPTGVVTDDLVEPEHQNRLADTVDRVLGLFLQRLMADGAHQGWELQSDKTVAAGEGLVAGCWCATTGSQAITGLTSGETNYVFATTTGASAPDGTVAFFAQLSATPPAGCVYLGTMALDAGGGVTDLDSDAPGVDRNCYRLEIRPLEGTGIVYDVPPGGVVELTVDHSSEGAFRALGPIELVVSEGFEGRVVEWHEATQFRAEAENVTGYPDDLTYSWRREGLVQ
jgi:hypothetical protein